MKNKRKPLRYFLCSALLLCAAWVASMGYGQVMAARSETAKDLATWLPKKRIVQLMRFHGTDILKVTPDEVFIPRGSRWILVMKRDRD